MMIAAEEYAYRGEVTQREYAQKTSLAACAVANYY